MPSLTLTPEAVDALVEACLIGPPKGSHYVTICALIAHWRKLQKPAVPDFWEALVREMDADRCKSGWCIEDVKPFLERAARLVRHD